MSIDFSVNSPLRFRSFRPQRICETVKFKVSSEKVKALMGGESGESTENGYLACMR